MQLCGRGKGRHVEAEKEEGNTVETATEGEVEAGDGGKEERRIDGEEDDNHIDGDDTGVDDFLRDLEFEEGTGAVGGDIPPSSGLLGGPPAACEDGGDGEGGVGNELEFEVSNIPVDWGSPEEECTRVLGKSTGVEPAASFDILKLPVYASAILLRKHFKKLSLLVHPDRCSHAQANEAFDRVKRAYEEVLKPENRGRYKAVVDEARERIKSRSGVSGGNGRSGRERSGMGEENREELIKACIEIVKEREERLTYAENVKKRNAQFEEKSKRSEESETQKRQAERTSWTEEREQRAAGWRECRDNILRAGKRFRGDSPLKRKERQ